MDIPLYDALVKWLRTFPGYENIATESLLDGVALGGILHLIAPEVFSSHWKSKIRSDVVDNWRLKVSNLRKIHQGVMDYFCSELAGQAIDQFPNPDLNKIGEHGDEIELGRLLQLILGCAINCQQKQKHIEAIMGMEEGVQALIVNAIQDLMNGELPQSPVLQDGSHSSAAAGGSSGPWFGPASFHPQMKTLVEQLESTSLAKEDMTRRCNALDLQISVLTEENSALAEDNKKLDERVEGFLNGADSTPQGSRYKELKKQVDTLQDELYKLESSRDEYRGRSEDLQKENSEVTLKNEELQKLADEARSLKDEVDALRDMSDRVAVYEGTVETYKKKMEELSDLKRQIKILEEKNSDYMHINMELEEEVKKSGTWRPQLELYKKQVADLHQKLSEEAKKTDRQIFDNKKIQERLEAITQEKERMILERDMLKENVEELKMSAYSSPETTSRPNSDLDDMHTLEIIPPEIRERLVRLQHENRVLKQKADERPNESGPVLQSMLNDLQERHDKLLQENREMNRHIMILESDVEEAKALSASYVSSQVSVVPKRSHSDESRNTAEFERKLNEQAEKINSLEEMLMKRENEMYAMEERYKRYLGKAKSVIKTLDPKHNAALMPDVSALRSQITEKNRLIEDMERESEKTKLVREVEEKMISTAFYNFGMQMHRHMVNQRLSALDQGQTFLNRQRQTSARRGSQNQNAASGSSGSAFYEY